MSLKFGKLFWPLFLLITCSASALTFISMSKEHRVVSGVPEISTPVNEAAHIQNENTTANRAQHIKRGQLWPELREAFKTLGDRLETPGKERLTLTGTLQRASDTQPQPIELILEFPNRLRLIVQSGGRPHVYNFDGDRPSASGRELNSSEEDLIETLAYDTPDHFFTGQIQGMATRSVGSRFRLDDGSTQNYDGPFFDIYQVAEEVRISRNSYQRSKFYYFNSDTNLLEQVRYEHERNGSTANVEVRLSNWQRIQGQQVPSSIVRMENDQLALTITITSTTVSPRIDDGIFVDQ